MSWARIALPVLQTPSFSEGSRKSNLSLRKSVKCSAKHWYSGMGVDLYDLLGVPSSSDLPQIKSAYRSLQKRCHPDIAGEPGHDMAIVLNDAYKILSTPSLRSEYDKEHEMLSEFHGYTGKPLYSTWLGSEKEDRAIFVDEVKCVGCLKCALLADKTFAVESVYGRARVVAQWAEDEAKIQSAIDACPVDCISMVDRSDLAALEFLMSKQPRGNVRVGASNTAGARVSNIFADVKKFQMRINEATTDSFKASHFRGIRTISSWLHRQQPTSKFAIKKLPAGAGEPSVAGMEKLRHAAAAMKQANAAGNVNHLLPEEYWVPTKYNLPASTNKATSKPTQKQRIKYNRKEEREYNRKNPIRIGFSLVMAISAVIYFRVSGGDTRVLEEHVGGSMALDLVNSDWFHDALAAATWYMIGEAIMNLVEMLGNRD